MRPLVESETKIVFDKLANYLSDLKSLIAPLDDGDRYVFRLNHSRVYYVRLSIANLATSISRDKLLSVGTCLGKLTKSGKFRLHITALPILAEHARHKIWVKENGAQPFLYGSNVVKAHVGRWTEDCPEHSGCVVYSMADVPLGFGVTSRSTADCRRLDPTGIVCFRQADCGEYLRDEDTLFAGGV
ncbi:60S ribosome subunit biogenesis protein NIP7 [Lasiosphaeria miniovina]|uniref:60S ribosome subunit biogenesis protein NIP7 n=1 Tax=Lasiosphaeria miniovina TaxID=1954250 RepID=A0AA40AM28_9PEZI|nr:60S ribosome subunit biogenesis protein NIP7 [Lasiosphaeria miniovina]KAK0718358.1 60S ribosome subunit biogenesis protein NIP7 [Lasiosphaeria miniovina]